MINFLNAAPAQPEPGFMQQYSFIIMIGLMVLLIEVDSNVTLRIDKNMVVADNSDLQQQR